MLTREARQLYERFAALTEYPGSSLLTESRDCAKMLEQFLPAEAEPVRSFALFVESQSLGALQELYTQTFDVSPASTLYLGYHIFGETPKRSVFLVKLREAYQDHSFSCGTELADHLGVILRFLGVAKDVEFVCPLVEECMLPVLTQIEKELRKNRNQYALILGPLMALLQNSYSQMKRTGVPSNG